MDKNNNRLMLELDESRPLVRANTEECTQLLWNLLGNAARHTQDGTVTLGIMCVQDELWFTIADTGEGISLEANRRILTKAGYEIETATTLAAARHSLKKLASNVIMLDVMLPDGSGIDFIPEIRQYTTAPILLLTAMAEKDQRISGLRAGGDDYISKPYDVDELRERVAAFLRRDTMVRNDQPMQSKLLCGELTLNLGKSEAFIGETDLLLSQKEFTLLLLLAQSRAKTSRSLRSV